jgi:2-polyprenyl-3-methyl-5-hydroxy-6-metoxy-1,4-benzoquinol methylase
MNDIEAVKSYYDENVMLEWQRLENYYPEFEITKRYLNRYIKQGEKVLDVGGGPGRYSLYLLNKDCDVTLIDLSQSNIDFAKEKSEEHHLDLKAVQGDARDIKNIVHDKFDHILLMGPLYHLIEEADRINTIKSCLDLLKPGGMIYIGFVSSNARIIYTLRDKPEKILDDSVVKDWRYFIDGTDFLGDSFTRAYFIKPENVLPFMEQFNLKKVHFLSCESILAPSMNDLKRQPQQVIDKWLDFAEKVCEREELMNFAEHLMYIGSKNGNQLKIL